MICMHVMVIAGKCCQTDVKTSHTDSYLSAPLLAPAPAPALRPPLHWQVSSPRQWSLCHPPPPHPPLDQLGILEGAPHLLPHQRWTGRRVG